MIPFAGRLTRIVSTHLLEGLGLDEDDAATVGNILGIGVTIATFDWPSAVSHLRDLADGDLEA
jgi:hypothetical protein